jgi:hypothetical protein
MNATRAMDIRTHAVAPWSIVAAYIASPLTLNN